MSVRQECFESGLRKFLFMPCLTDVSEHTEAVQRSVGLSTGPFFLAKLMSELMKILFIYIIEIILCRHYSVLLLRIAQVFLCYAKILHSFKCYPKEVTYIVYACSDISKSITHMWSRSLL